MCTWHVGPSNRTPRKFLGHLLSLLFVLSLTLSSLSLLLSLLLLSLFSFMLLLLSSLSLSFQRNTATCDFVSVTTDDRCPGCIWESSGWVGCRCPRLAGARSVAPHLPEAETQLQQSLPPSWLPRFAATIDIFVKQSFVILDSVSCVTDARGSGCILGWNRRVCGWRNRLWKTGWVGFCLIEKTQRTCFWNEKKLLLVTSRPYFAAAAHHHAFPPIPCKFHLKTLSDSEAVNFHDEESFRGQSRVWEGEGEREGRGLRIKVK